MQPQLFGFNSYYISWLIGAFCGVWVAVRLAERKGFSRRAAFLGSCALALSILVGSKLLFLIEHSFFPLDDPIPGGDNSFNALLRHGFRIPGGVLLMGVTLPLVCRGLALRTREFADAVFPGVGVAIFFIRIGCLLSGCCFGDVTQSPLAITFPPGNRTYDWQVREGLIQAGAPHTLPVHPLQVYFALLGLLLYWLARRWQDSQRFPGEVWANFYVVFFSGTFLLELLRPRPLHLNLILTATVVTLTAAVALRARLTTPALVRVPS